MVVPLPELRLLVRERCQAPRAPVDDAVAPVDEPVVVQLYEHPLHRAAIAVVEREARPVPVAGAPDGLELVENRAARLAHVLPHALDERLAPEVLPPKFLAGELSLHHVLRCDAGVVGARQPQRLAAAHPLEPNQHVLNRVVQPVPHVQHGCHVGWRDDDDVRLPLGRDVGGEYVGLRPGLVHPALDGRGIVFRSEFRRLGHGGEGEGEAIAGEGGGRRQPARERDGRFATSSPATRMRLTITTWSTAPRATVAAAARASASGAVPVSSTIPSERARARTSR